MGVSPPTPSACVVHRPDWVPDDAGEAFATSILQGARPGGVVRPPSGVTRRRTLSVEDYVQGVLARDRMVLGRAITLVESNAAAHQLQAQQLLARLLPHTGTARRLGITGIPGAGKSTFIEALGCHLTDQGRRVAVLAIDPTSSRTGGSILGDKVRMERLAQRTGAFIRPSPSGGTLGGVARKTREAMLVCEAAGFDVVIVETVGVGQNEIAVRAMVDCFLVLMIAGAGDEIQGIKKGVLELADAVVINKADGENQPRAAAAQAEMRRVLHYLQRATPGWDTPVFAASALTSAGISDTWRAIEDFFKTVGASGDLELRRRSQSVDWLRTLLDEGLRARFFAQAAVREKLPALERAVAGGQQPVFAAVQELLGSL